MKERVCVLVCAYLHHRQRMDAGERQGLKDSSTSAPSACSSRHRARQLLHLLHPLLYNLLATSFSAASLARSPIAYSYMHAYYIEK